MHGQLMGLFLIFREYYFDELHVNNVVIFIKHELWRRSRLVWLLGNGKILYISLILHRLWNLLQFSLYLDAD